MFWKYEDLGIRTITKQVKCLAFYNFKIEVIIGNNKTIKKYYYCVRISRFRVNLASLLWVPDISFSNGNTLQMVKESRQQILFMGENNI